MQDDDGSHLRLQPEEAAFDLVAVDDRRFMAGDRRSREGEFGQFDVDAMAPQSARLIDAGAHDEAVKPGVEAVGIAERGQITPGSDERVLDGVLGLFDIPQDQPGGTIQPGDRGACQLGEGVMIALPRSLHEFSLHDAPRRVRRPSGRAQ